MAKFARALGVFLIFTIVTDLASADCFINFPSEPERVPLYNRTLGWKWLKVPYTNRRVDIYDDERIEATCAYGFSDPTWLQNELDIIGRCHNDRVLVLTHRHDIYPQYVYNGATFSCSGPNLHIYQSMETFEWCEPHTESYFIETQLPQRQNYTLAYFCYDVEAKKLQTITYKASPKYKTDDHNKITFPSWPHINISSDAKMEVRHFEKVLSHSLTAEELHTAVSENIWLELGGYSYSPIVQTGAYSKFFSGLNSALDIMWWPNLLRGNWRRFNEALEEHANEVEYTVTTGTSGISQVPHQNPLTGKLELQTISFGSMNTTVPKYIWSFGISDDGKHSFLVVSYNSPYFNLTNKEETVFCHDICDQHDWLKEARSTFSFPIMGVTFCCSMDEALDVLEGLPINLINETRVANQTTSPDTSDISSTPSTTSDYS